MMTPAVRRTTGMTLSNPIDELVLGDALDVVGLLPDGCADALVTDPPAGISFMQRGWDGDRGGRVEWVGWLTAVLAETRRVVKPGGYAVVWSLPRRSHWTGLALEDAGWRVIDSIHHIFGTGFPKGETTLKPAHECWWLASNGPGRSLGIDASRVPYVDDADKAAALKNGAHKRRDTSDRYGWARVWMDDPERVASLNAAARIRADAGRYPPNVVISHAEACPDGCPVDDLEQHARMFPTFRYAPKVTASNRVGHPTQKGLELMRWFVRLVTPVGGTVLDCFVGSGTTALAAKLEGMHFIAVDSDPGYIELARGRLGGA